MHDVLFKILKKYVSLQYLYFVTACDYIINGNQYIRLYYAYKMCLSLGIKEIDTTTVAVNETTEVSNDERDVIIGVVFAILIVGILIGIVIAICCRKCRRKCCRKNGQEENPDGPPDLPGPRNLADLPGPRDLPGLPAPRDLPDPPGTPGHLGTVNNGVRDDDHDQEINNVYAMPDEAHL